MKLIQNYIFAKPAIQFKGTDVPTSRPVQSEDKEKNVAALPAVAPDYNVKTPIAYSQLEDIKISDDLTAKCYKLANGQRVVILPKDGPTYVKTYVNTGSFNEPDNLRGISHYIEHNLFNGSEDLGDKVFFDEVNKMGANTNASTSFSVTDYYIQSNLLEDTDLENKIELHAGMLQSPKFLLDKLEKEKKIVNSEINMYMSDDESLGFTQTVKNLFNIKSTSLDLVAGNTDNIDKLTRDDVVNYFKSNYYPANMVTVVTGEVNPDETIGLISKYFTAKNNPVQQRHFEKMTPVEKPVRQDIISPKSMSGRASVFLGFAGPENNNTKAKIHLQAAIYLTAGLENSRTAKIERDYGIGLNMYPERLSSRPEDKTIMMVETTVSNGKSELLLKDLYSAIDSLSKTPPTNDELTAIKNRLKKGYNEVFERSGALNHRIGTSILNNDLAYFSDYNKIVDEMSADDILNAAKKYLDLNKAALTVVHPHKVTEEEIKNDYNLISQISFTGLNKKTPVDVNKVSKYVLPNNFEVVLFDSNSDNIEYNMIMEEKNWTPKKAAISNILSDMLVTSGTKTKSIEEVSKEEDMLALDCSINATQYGLSAGGTFPIDSFDKSFEHINDLVKNPNLSEESFEQAKQRLKEAYSNIEPSVYEKFDPYVFEGMPRGFNVQDKLKSIDEITLDDIKSFYDNIFVKSQGQVVVSAPFSKNPELKQKIFNSVGTYGKLQPKDVSLVQSFKPINEVKVFTQANLKNQAKIIEGFKFKHNGNLKDETCVSLLNDILGGSSSSRLFSDLREQRHLAYSVSSGVSYTDDIGLLTLKIGTTTENVETGEKTFDNIQKSIEGFNENIQKLTSEKVSVEELESVKKAMKSSLLTFLETNYGKTIDIMASNNTPYGIDYINKQFEIIDSITPDDIYNTARYIFKENPVYSLTATQASLDANKEFLDSLTKQQS